MFAYYSLTNYYQNHRLYVMSRDFRQLMGNERTEAEVKDNCKGAVTNQEIGRTVAADGKTPLDPKAVAYPCGITAKSLFNDTYALYPEGFVGQK